MLEIGVVLILFTFLKASTRSSNFNFNIYAVYKSGKQIEGMEKKSIP